MKFFYRSEGVGFNFPTQEEMKERAMCGHTVIRAPTRIGMSVLDTFTSLKLSDDSRKQLETTHDR